MPLSSRTLLSLLISCAVPALACAQVSQGPPAAVNAQVSPAPAPGGFFDDLFGRFLPRVGYSYDAGDNVGRDGGLSSFQAFIPVWEGRDATGLLFSDSRLLLFDNKGTVGANLGLGGRVFSDSLGRTVGGYVYWDYSDTGRASFTQVSGGFETLGDVIDARANFYVPVSKDRKTVEQSFTPASAEPYFQNNSLVVGGGQGTRTLEQALYGFDTEAGLRFFANDSLELRAFAGMYHYQAEAAMQAWGPRGRLEARLRDTLAMGLSVQNDRLFGTTVNLNVLMTFPRLTGRGYADGPAAPLVAGDRLGDPIVRAQHVAVLRRQESYIVPGQAMVDPLTGQPYVFLHVAPGGNSDGSFESPYATLTAAFADPRFTKGNLVVYDRSQGTFVGNVQFAPGTRLLSSGPVQLLDSSNAGLVKLPFSGASPDLAKAPVIQGSLAVANASVVSGFNLRPGVGISSITGPTRNSLRDVVIVSNRFQGGATAVQLANVAGVIVVGNNRMTATAGGVVLGVQGDQPTSIFVRDNQITQAKGDGIRVVAGGRSAVTLAMEGNSIEGATGSGAVVSMSEGGSATVRAAVRGNKIKDGGGAGAIVLEAQSKGASMLSATVAENQLPGNRSPGVTARAGGGNTLELDLFDNKALSPQAMFSFLLQQQGKGTFHLVGPETIGARNTGSVITTGTITAIGAVR